MPIVTPERNDAIEEKLRRFLDAYNAQPSTLLNSLAGSVEADDCAYRLSDGRMLVVQRDNWIYLAIDGEADLLREVGAYLGVDMRSAS